MSKGRNNLPTYENLMLRQGKRISIRDPDVPDSSIDRARYFGFLSSDVQNILYLNLNIDEMSMKRNFIPETERSNRKKKRSAKSQGCVQDVAYPVTKFQRLLPVESSSCDSNLPLDSQSMSTDTKCSSSAVSCSSGIIENTEDEGNIGTIKKIHTFNNNASIIDDISCGVQSSLTIDSFEQLSIPEKIEFRLSQMERNTKENTRRFMELISGADRNNFNALLNHVNDFVHERGTTKEEYDELNELMKQFFRIIGASRS